MLKVFLISHGEMAIETLKSAEMIMGPQKELVAIPFYSHESCESLVDKIENEIKVSKAESYVLIVDLKGGTPFNASVLLSSKYNNIAIVTGLNLPIVLEAIVNRETIEEAEELANILINIGKDSIENIII